MPQSTEKRAPRRRSPILLLATGSAAVPLSLIVGLGVGLLIASMTFGAGPDPPTRLDTLARSGGQSATEWPKNAHGLTYGSALDAATPEDEPDLILTEATNGQVGYVHRTELDGDPKTPEEAIRQQVAQGDKGRLIPIYQSDGTTQVGVFFVQPSQSERTQVPSE